MRPVNFGHKTLAVGKVGHQHIGSAFLGSDVRVMEVRGRNLPEGVPTRYPPPRCMKRWVVEAGPRS